MRFAAVRFVVIGCLLLPSITASSNTCIGHDKRAPVRAVCGRVYNQIGELAEGAELTLVDESGTTRYTATIDQRGAFSFGPVSKGDYTLHAMAPGYRGEERKLRVTRDQEKRCKATIDVKLGVISCGGGTFVKGVDKMP